MTPQKLENLTLYEHKLSPPCRFVNMVLEHLNIDCNREEIDFVGGQHKTSEYEAINPAKLIPALVDGDLKLAESRAIACYLCNQYAPENDLYPRDPVKRARVDQVLYADTNFVEVIYKFTKLKEMIFTEYRKPDFSDDSTVQNAFALYEKFLTQHKYLADDNITLADLSAINAVDVLETINYTNFSGFPRLKEWIEKMRKLPYYEDCCRKPCRVLTGIIQEKLKA